MRQLTLGQLSEAEVQSRVLNAPEDAVPQLAEMGRWLVEQAIGLTARLDGKATTLAGFAAGLLAFVAVSDPAVRWATASMLARGGGVVGALACVFAVVCAVLSLWVQTFSTISDETWLHVEVLPRGQLDLQRFYATAWHQAHTVRLRVNDRKARWIRASQAWLAFGAIAFAVSVVAQAVGAVGRTTP